LLPEEVLCLVYPNGIQGATDAGLVPWDVNFLKVSMSFHIYCIMKFYCEVLIGFTFSSLGLSSFEPPTSQVRKQGHVTKLFMSYCLELKLNICLQMHISLLDDRNNFFSQIWFSLISFIMVTSYEH
jgi:hypothetical protein